MKKYSSVTLLIFLMIAVLLTGCMNKDANQKNTAANNDIDLDLTVMSGTVAYAQAVSIMEHPYDYLGKTIKVNGLYYASYFEQTGLYYHVVYIGDETACCLQPMEFVWNGEHTYPDDYPEEQSKIEVVGVFGLYEELGKTYYYLEVNEILCL